MNNWTTPPFRADHVGSLLRPAELLAAYEGVENGRLSRADLYDIAARHSREAIAMQERIGLQGVTDGEFRRVIYFGHFTTAVSGFTMTESEISFDEDGRSIKYLSPTVTGKLRHVGGIATDEFKFVQANTSRTPKVTLPSPADQHAFRYREGISDAVYPDLDEFLADVAQVYRTELAELGKLGASYVQFDDTTFTLFCDAKWRERFRVRGYDPDDMVRRYVELINAAVAEKPAGMAVVMHMCRGNNQGEWLFSGGYDAVAEAIFTRLDLDGFFLEYDSERAGSFAPLRFIPPSKRVILGLVTSKSPQMEEEADLLQRIEAAGRYFPHEQMGISPQCGFASTAPGNPLTPDDQWRKLALVVQVAEKVWR